MKKILSLNTYIVCTLLFFQNFNSNAQSSVLSTGTWYKFSAKETGVYVITYYDLISLGINVSTINPRNISIFSNGPGELPSANNAPRPIDLGEIAIQIKGENDGVFDTVDSIFFYNQSQIKWAYDTLGQVFHHTNNSYSDSVSYFLRVGSTTGKRIPTLIYTGAYTDSVSTFTDYELHELDSINLILSGKEWYGEQFNSSSASIRSFPFSTNELSPGEAVKVTSRFAARSLISPGPTATYISNAANFTQNFQIVGSSYIDNYANEWLINLTVNPPITTGNITIHFQSSDTAALGWLNYIELNSIRNLNLVNSQMSFRAGRNFGPNVALKYKLTSASNLTIWDVSDFSNVKIQSITGTTPSFSFNAINDNLREYIAFNGSTFYTPVFQGVIPNQNLHSISQANMLIIHGPDFYSDANRLAQHHQSFDNLTSRPINIDQVYNEYSSGQQDPIAIRDFLRQVYYSSSALNDSLKYVLLFGNATYDYKNKLGLGGNIIPIFESQNSLNRGQSFCSDDPFTKLDSSESALANSSIPDIAIGRIPARNISEAAIVDKIILYSTASSFSSWRTQVTGVADDEEGNLFISQADTLMNRIENTACELNLGKIYLDSYVQQVIGNQQTYPDGNLALRNAIEEGKVIINYVGVSNERDWAEEKILQADYLDTVQNAGTLPLFVALTSPGYNIIDNPSSNSGGRTLLFNPNGGGIGSIAPSRIVFASSNFNFSRHLHNALFDPATNILPRVGEVFLYAKKQTYADIYTSSICLLGDPAVKLLRPELNVVTTNLSTDTLVYGETVQLDGEIHNPNGTLAGTFTGDIDICIYNPKTEHRTLANDPNSYVTSFYLWDDTIHYARIAVVNGHFSHSFVVPPVIDSGFGIGKIMYYAQNGILSAAGCYGQITVKNLTFNIDELTDVSASIYPNPALNEVKCSIGTADIKGWSYDLNSIDGKLLRKESIINPEFVIKRNSLASGLYFLKIKNEKNQTSKTIKFIFE